MQTNNFVPTTSELQLADRLLETGVGSWNHSNNLSVDAAIGIFKHSGISFRQLRDIWAIADRDGIGSLSKEGLAVVIRLMGWVQAGATLDEGLLKKAGPLPKLKGVPDKIPRHIDPPLPALTYDDVEKFREKFSECGPINGLVQKPQVAEVYIGTMPHLSFETYLKIMQLLEIEDGLLNFKQFAIGMHIVEGLFTSLISSVPDSVIPENYTILDTISIEDERSEAQYSDSSVQGQDITLPEIVDSDLLLFLKDVELHGKLVGSMTLKLSAQYKIDPTEIAEIWRKSDIGYKRELTPDRMAMIEQLLRRRMAQNVLENDIFDLDSRSLTFDHPTGALPPYSPSISAQPQWGEHHGSTSFMEKYDLSPCRHFNGPYTVGSNEEFYQSCTVAPNKKLLPKLKKKVQRLTRWVKGVALKGGVSRPVSTFAERAGQIFVSKHQENLPFENFRRAVLQGELSQKEEQYLNSRLRASPDDPEFIKFIDKLMQIYDSTPKSTNFNVEMESDDLRDTLETQDSQFEHLSELVDDMKATIAYLQNKPRPKVVGPRPLIKGISTKTKAGVAKPIEDAQTLLRQTVSNQEKEIIELRKCLEEFKSLRSLSQTDKELMDLRNSHEHLKRELEDIKGLLQKRFTTSSTEHKTGGNNMPTQAPSAGHHVLSTRRPSLSLRPMTNGFNDHEEDPPLSFPPSSNYMAISPRSPRANPSDNTIGTFSNHGDLSMAPSPDSTTIPSSPIISDNLQHGASPQSDNSLRDFDLRVLSNGHLDPPPIESRYNSDHGVDVDTFSLGGIRKGDGGLVLDSSQIEYAMDLIRRALTHPHGYRAPSLSRSSSCTARSLYEGF